MAEPIETDLIQVTKSVDDLDKKLKFYKGVAKIAIPVLFVLILCVFVFGLRINISFGSFKLELEKVQKVNQIQSEIISLQNQQKELNDFSSIGLEIKEDVNSIILKKELNDKRLKELYEELDKELTDDPRFFFPKER